MWGRGGLVGREEGAYFFINNPILKLEVWNFS